MTFYFKESQKFFSIISLKKLSLFPISLHKNYSKRAKPNIKRFSEGNFLYFMFGKMITKKVQTQNKKTKFTANKSERNTWRSHDWQHMPDCFLISISKKYRYAALKPMPSLFRYWLQQTLYTLINEKLASLILLNWRTYLVVLQV